MNFAEIINQIKSQLEEIEAREKANQKEQAELTKNIEQLNQNIVQLQLEIEEKIYRQSQLDQEALELCRLGEDLREKQEKIAKIQSFSEHFQGLQAELQGNKDLLNTLYSSVSTHRESNFFETTNDDLLDNSDRETEETPSMASGWQVVHGSEETSVHFSVNSESSFNEPPESTEEFNITIDTIKAKLPQAERLYQKLVAQHLEQYHTYQNLIIHGLDLIWFSVGFIAFGKEAYKKMSLKYHPDRQGSAQAMQLINTAWEITEEYLNNQAHFNY